MTYDDLLTLLSLAVILDAKSDAGRLIETNKSEIESDRILNCITSLIKNGTVNWDKNIALKQEYDLLNQVFVAKDKEEAIKAYLTKWYEAHSGYAWYNAHLRDTDTYCGYWSFESAAIVEILNIKEEKIRDLEYYPML